ncbi:MAG: NAD(P)H-dependent oxidoreductase [Bacteroidales bacterium]|nr:NAD(P)H-dependent oxidoreductase [Bacteroidales bacterium]
MSKKLVAFNGSRRKNGNTSILLEHFLKGAKNNAIKADAFNAHELNLEYCRGCLRCNLLGYCSIHGDDWAMVAEKILDADVIVFASPIYFHHLSASMKKLLDRFRSFVKVQVTETDLIHTPHTIWKKDFVLLLTMGSSNTKDAAPVIDLFKYITSILGPENKLHIITANRLVVVNQLLSTEEELVKTYNKLQLPVYLAKEDVIKNQELLDKVSKLGRSLLA